jgi:hypothetical protein
MSKHILSSDDKKDRTFKLLLNMDRYQEKRTIFTIDELKEEIKSIRSITIDSIKDFLKCSERTAYDYLKALHLIESINSLDEVLRNLGVK